MCKSTHVQVVPGTDELITKRLRLRPWTVDDADAALAIFGQRQVARWLAPAMPRVADRNQMRLLLARWIAQHDNAGRPLGRWVIETRDSGRVVGAVALLPLPPGCTDLEIGWQITPAAWGHGYGAEAGHAVAHQVSPTGCRRCSPLCAQATPAASRPHGASEWSGSARPRNTTGSHCKSIVSPQPIWTIPNRARMHSGTKSASIQWIPLRQCPCRYALQPAQFLFVRQQKHRHRRT